MAPALNISPLTHRSARRLILLAFFVTVTVGCGSNVTTTVTPTTSSQAGSGKKSDSSGAAKTVPVKDVKERIQGRWSIVTMTKVGKPRPHMIGAIWDIVGTKVTLKVKGKKDMKFDIVRENQKAAHHFDMGMGWGPFYFKRPAIFRLEGDRLEICAAMRGESRPLGFEEKHVKTCIHTVLKRLPD